MQGLALDDGIIKKVKTEAVELIRESIGQEVREIILYGSCARGDYTEDSDIDIALLMKCSRMEAQKYNDVLARIATELAMKYFAIVNFVCLPYDEFSEKSTWFAYFKNIKTEGEVLYG